MADGGIDTSMAARKAQLMTRWSALRNERSTWLDHWRDLSENIRPRGSRFLYADRNKGYKVNSKIINLTPALAERTLAAGMMSGITSPARPWFRLTTPIPGLDEVYEVKAWLRAVEDRLRVTFARSNLYNCLHQVYSDLGVHGTSALHVEEDAHTLVRGYNFPIGQYCLALGGTGEVDTSYRELSFTVRQLVERFGLESCSVGVQNLFKSRQYDQWVLCLHIVQPRTEGYREGALGPAGKRWESIWLEQGGDANKLLGQSGYHEFPIMAPRWEVTGEDVYGTSPGMMALGDCRQLQLLEKRGAQVADKLVDPPMKGPASLRNTRASLLPGDVTYVDAPSPGQAFMPAHEVPPQALTVVETKTRELEGRIKSAFYADLWLMLAQADGQMTAREVIERREEKLLQLGTVLERLQLELLDPLIDRVFAILARKGLIPPPPKEIQGMALRVEYVSIMAQAQKLLGVTGIERLVGFTAQLAGLKPEALDKLDVDQAIDEYSTMLGTPPVVVVPDDRVEQVRQKRAAAQAQQQKMAQLQQGAMAAKSLAQAQVPGRADEQQNALSTLLQGMGQPPPQVP